MLHTWCSSLGKLLPHVPVLLEVAGSKQAIWQAPGSTCAGHLFPSWLLVFTAVSGWTVTGARDVNIRTGLELSWASPFACLLHIKPLLDIGELVSDLPFPPFVDSSSTRLTVACVDPDVTINEEPTRDSVFLQ